MTERQSSRPLSPHLMIYKPQMTSMLSILHRMTGFALVVGVLFFLYWLVALAMGPEAYATVEWFYGLWIGKLMLLGWTFCGWYHLANGIRHLIWDSGFLFELKNAYMAGYAVLAFSAIMTIVTWVCAYI